MLLFRNSKKEGSNDERKTKDRSLIGDDSLSRNPGAAGSGSDRGICERARTEHGGSSPNPALHAGDSGQLLDGWSGNIRVRRWWSDRQPDNRLSAGLTRRLIYGHA